MARRIHICKYCLQQTICDWHIREVTLLISIDHFKQALAQNCATNEDI